MAKIDRVYYMRVGLGAIAGIIAGFLIAPEFDNGTSVGIAFGMAVLFFGISLGISRGMTRGLSKERRKKAGYDGIVPFIFMNIVFMIIVYTALHQDSILK